MRAAVVGCGAIGTQVATQLAHAGIGAMTLIDFDKVSVENMGSQGFHETDLNKSKVAALAQKCKRINSQTDYEEKKEAFSGDTGSHAVFCCVDSMEAREFIRRESSLAQFFVDGRMNALSMRIITDEPINNEPELFNYYDTIFPDGEMMQGSCTARATIYTASIAAGLMLNQFVLWLNNAPYPNDFTFSLTALELTEANDGEEARIQTENNLQRVQQETEEHDGASRPLQGIPRPQPQPTQRRSIEEGYREEDIVTEGQILDENHTPQDWPYDHPAGHRGL